MSGYTDDLIAEKAIRDGEVELIRKPFTNKQLLRAVRSRLDGPS